MIEKKIKFTSIIADGAEQVFHEFVAIGKVYVAENGTISRIDFPEPIENDLTLETSIIIADNSLKIVREGVISMAQEFVLGEEIVGTYETEYGLMDTAVYTKVLDVSGDSDSGEVYLVYDFYFDAEYASQISLNIEYE